MSEQRSFEEEYYDILRTIELKLFQLSEDKPHLLDYNIEKALNGMVRTLTSEQRGRSAPALKLKEDDRAVYQQLQAIATLYTGKDDTVKPDQLLSTEEMINCFKRIQRSLKQMSGQGRQGYVHFLQQFFGD